MMTSPVFRFAAGAAAVLLCVFAFANTPGSQAQEPDGNYGVGIPEVFLPKYLAYRDAQLASGTPDVMRIRLGYVKGLSTSFVDMTGEATVNLAVRRIPGQPERADAAHDSTPCGSSTERRASSCHLCQTRCSAW